MDIRSTEYIFLLTEKEKESEEGGEEEEEDLVEFFGAPTWISYKHPHFV